MVWSESDAQLIADLEVLSAFCALAIHLDLAGFYRLHCQSACFEEPRGP
jgi:hypothetical protein